MCLVYSLKLLPHLACWYQNPFATSVNCVSRLEGYRERPVFAEEARLALISRGVSDPHSDPAGQESRRFHTATHRTRMGLQQPIVIAYPPKKTANCHVRNFGLLGNIIHSLCPSSTLLIQKGIAKVTRHSPFLVAKRPCRGLVWVWVCARACVCVCFLQNIFFYNGITAKTCFETPFDRTWEMWHYCTEEQHVEGLNEIKTTSSVHHACINAQKKCVKSSNKEAWRCFQQTNMPIPPT